jgi:diadenosine tetraphosphate (Ap4A) HIT family hydrolase
MKHDPCPFCEIDRPVQCENDFALAIRDSYPVSNGHTLIVPKRHIADITKLSTIEYGGCWALAKNVVGDLRKTLSPDGINIGVNCGEAAGQTVFHAHIHVIPRFFGDTSSPRGGVRGVIPDKQQY